MTRSGARLWVAVVTFCMLIGVSLFAETSSVKSLTDQPEAISTAIVWSDSDGTDSEIFLTYLQDGSWQGPVQLTDNMVMDSLPTVCVEKNGKINVVWTQNTGDQSDLTWVRYYAGQISKVVSIDTGMRSNTAPSLFVDGKGAIGLVFAGFDGQDDDIFNTYLIDDAWEQPQRISLDDAVPDITPIIGIDGSGKVRVTWIGFSFEGTYRAYQSIRKNGEWEPEAEIGPKDMLELVRSGSIDGNLEIPGYVNRRTASVYGAGSQGGVSVPLRNM